MSARRSGLATLLTMRSARSEAAKTELSASRGHRRDLADALRRERDALAGADLSGGGDFAVAAALRALRCDAVIAATAALAQAVQVEATAAVRYQADRRSERVLEKLLDRLDVARDAARARAEQAGLDELALARHARTQQPAAQQVSA